MNINASLISEEHSTLNDFMNVLATGLWSVHFSRASSNLETAHRAVATTQL
jgi:hypothetical protein